MSVQSLAKFVQEVSTDRALERRCDAALAGGTDKQAALIAFAASEGYTFDREELAAIVATRSSLSEGALDKVAGGFNPQPEPPGRFALSQSTQLLNFFTSKGIIIVGG